MVGVITVLKKTKEKNTFTNLLLLLGLLAGSGASLLLALALLQEGLGDEDLVLGGDGAVKVSLVCPQKTEQFRRV